MSGLIGTYYTVQSVSDLVAWAHWSKVHEPSVTAIKNPLGISWHNFLKCKAIQAKVLTCMKQSPVHQTAKSSRLLWNQWTSWARYHSNRRRLLEQVLSCFGHWTAHKSDVFSFETIPNEQRIVYTEAKVITSWQKFASQWFGTQLSGFYARTTTTALYETLAYGSYIQNFRSVLTLMPTFRITESPSIGEAMQNESTRLASCNKFAISLTT